MKLRPQMVKTMIRNFYRLAVVFLALSLTSCGTFITQLTPPRFCSGYNNESDGTVPNVYSGVVLDVLGGFHYGCAKNECKFLYEGTNNVELFFILDIPLSVALDTALLPITVYKQIRYGNVCEVQPKKEGAEAHLIAIDVKPFKPIVAKGARQQFTATGAYSDGTTLDISAYVTWSSSDVSRATIESSGVATASEPGTVLITATSGKIAGSSSLVVTE